MELSDLQLIDNLPTKIFPEILDQYGALSNPMDLERSNKSRSSSMLFRILRKQR